MTVTPWLVSLLLLLPNLGPVESTISIQDTNGATPEIRLDATEEDHGKYLQGEKYTKKLKVYNDGKATLNISKVVGSCGCIEILLGFPKTIAPGGEGVIEYEIDTKKIKPGDSLKEIRVSSDDPHTPKAKYRFTTEVINLFRTNPNPVSISGIVDQSKESIVDIYSATDLGFELLDIRSRDGKFEVTENKLIAKDKHYRATLRLGAAEAARKDRGILDMVIRVRDGRTVTIGTWVELEHRPHILVQPAEMFFNNKDTNKLLEKEPKPVTKHIMVAATTAKTRFQVTGVTIEGVADGVFTADFKPLIDGTRYQIMVTLSEYQKKSYLSGKIIVATTDPKFPKIELPLRAMFGRRVRR